MKRLITNIHLWSMYQATRYQDLIEAVKNSLL
jgi:hypothetical protein